MIKVIIVNGRPGAGKTTFEDICQALMGPYCRSRSTIDKIKEVAMRARWDGKKTPNRADEKIKGKDQLIKSAYNCSQ